MFPRLSFFIAWRYSTTSKQNSFISFINGFSIAGIALGLMALIIVLSVMNGFEEQMKTRILGIMPQITVSGVDKTEIDKMSLPDVRASMAYKEVEGLVQSRQSIKGVWLQGIEPLSMTNNSVVANNMVAGRFNLLKPGDYGVVIGRALANELGVTVGNKIRLMVSGASVYTPFGRLPSQRLAVVTGIFDLRSQLDDKVIYLNLYDLKKLMRLNSESVVDSRLFLHDAFNYQQTEQQLMELGYKSENWRTRQGPLFDAVKMEKNMMFLMLLLIIAVATFNIVSALVMVVTEKQGDIAILQTQGMGSYKIMSIFIFNGILNGLKGSAIGLVLGITAVWQLNNILELLGVHLALSTDGKGLPIEMNLVQILGITAFALILCFLASLYPALRALAVQPATALQND